MTPAVDDPRATGRGGAHSRDESLRASRAARARPSALGRRIRLRQVVQAAITVTNDFRKLPARCMAVRGADSHAVEWELVRYNLAYLPLEARLRHHSHI